MPKALGFRLELLPFVIRLQPTENKTVSGKLGNVYFNVTLKTEAVPIVVLTNRRTFRTEFSTDSEFLLTLRIRIV